MAIEQEDFTTQTNDTSSPPPEPFQDDGGDVTEAPRPTVRDHIEKGFEDARKAEQPERGAKPKARKAKGYDRSAHPEEEPEARPRQGLEQRPQEQDQRGQRDSQAQGTATESGPPRAWNKEAQAEWNNLPPTIQAEVIKRENDIQRGVQQLRSKYSEIDEAIAPHFEAIRSNGFTPGQAVGQLFQWFKALYDNPVVAFPALAQSFGMDLHRLVAASQQQYEQQQLAQQQEQQQLEQIPPYIRDIYQQNFALTERLSKHEQMLQQQNESRTHEVINTWAGDKQFFEPVRHLMGQLIASGAVPLKAGRVDLDGAYAMACRAHPEIWQQLSTAQQAAYTNAQKQATERQRTANQQRVDKARLAGSSIPSGAPGLGNGIGKANQQKKGQSVKESILSAIQEVGQA